MSASWLADGKLNSLGSDRLGMHITKQDMARDGAMQSRLTATMLSLTRSSANLLMVA